MLHILLSIPVPWHHDNNSDDLTALLPGGKTDVFNAGQKNRCFRASHAQLVLSFQTSPEMREVAAGQFGVFTRDGVLSVKETAIVAFRESHLAVCHVLPDFMRNPKVGGLPLSNSVACGRRGWGGR